MAKQISDALSEVIENVADEMSVKNPVLEKYKEFFADVNIEDATEVIFCNSDWMFMLMFRAISDKVPLNIFDMYTGQDMYLNDFGYDSLRRLEDADFLADYIDRFDQRRRDFLRDGYKQLSEENRAQFLQEAVFSQKRKMEYLLELSHLDKNAYVRSIEFIASLRQVDEFYKELDKSIEESDDLARHKGKKKFNKILVAYLKDNLDDLGVSDEIKVIMDFYHGMLKDYQKNRLSLKKKASKYSNIRDNMNYYINRGQLLEVEKLVEQIEEESIKKKVLQYIYEAGIEEYGLVNNELTTLLNDPKVKYRHILTQNGVSVSDDDLEEIMKIPFEQLEVCIKQLSAIGLGDSGLIVKILTGSEFERVGKLLELVNDGYLTAEFIESNQDLFNKDNDKYQTIISNVGLFKYLNVNPLYVVNNQRNLLIDAEILCKNVEILREYKLFKGVKANTDLGFLACVDLYSLLDTVIELGFEKALKKDLNLLNRGLEKWQRIQVLRSIGIPVFDSGELKQILDDENFMIGDEELGNYIFSSVGADINERLNKLQVMDGVADVQMLEKYIVSPLTYNIGGVCVSRPKVERNMRKLIGSDLGVDAKLLMSCVNNSVLSEEEYCSIKRTFISDKTYKINM